MEELWGRRGGGSSGLTGWTGCSILPVGVGRGGGWEVTTREAS